MSASATHPGELVLRRHRIGELPPSESTELAAHMESCPSCRGRLAALEQEQQKFEAQIPLDRFVWGVERSARPVAKPSRGRLAIAAPLVAAAAAVLLVFPLLRHPASTLGANGELTHPPLGHNRIKGGAEVELRVAPPDDGPQRVAAVDAPEALAPGERVRVGFKSPERRYLAAASVDADGQVSALYPEQGTSVLVEPSAQLSYLPDSLEFTGSGLESVVVLLSTEPIPVEQVTQALGAAYQRAHGDLKQLPELELRGEQFHRLLLKP